MSTRSNIAHYNKETQTLTKIYCHHDGYMSYNGKILLEHYNTEQRVLELLKLGDLSSLNKYLSPEDYLKAVEDKKDLLPNKYSVDDIKSHSFDNGIDEICIAYGRDRKEENVSAVIKTVSFEKLEQELNEEYLYVFCNGSWLVAGRKTKDKLVPLTPKLVLED